MGTPPENIESPTTTAPVADAGRGRQDITPQQLAIVGGVVLLIVLGLVYFFFLRGGGEEVEAPPVAEGVPAPDETPAEEEPDEDDGDDPDDEGKVETFQVFAPRDPFDPLISDDLEGGAAAAPADGDGGVVDGGDGGQAVDQGDTIGDHRVKVVDVFVENGRDRAQIQVDGSVYTVDEGENFAENFRLVSASGQCATILFGDDEFTLCEGEEILK